MAGDAVPEVAREPIRLSGKTNTAPLNRLIITGRRSLMSCVRNVASKPHVFSLDLAFKGQLVQPGPRTVVDRLLFFLECTSFSLSLNQLWQASKPQLQHSHAKTPWRRLSELFRLSVDA